MLATTVVLKKYLNKITWYKVIQEMTELEDHLFLLQKIMNNVPVNLVKVSSAKSMSIYPNYDCFVAFIENTFFYTHLFTLGQLNAQFGNSHKQLVREKFNVTGILCQSHKQNVSTAPLLSGRTLHFRCLHHGFWLTLPLYWRPVSHPLPLSVMSGFPTVPWILLTPHSRLHDPLP